MSFTCDWCGETTTRGVGCTMTQFDDLPDGPFDRIPYASALAALECPDCAVLPGQYHHPGCDTEWCPRCRVQLLVCTCFSSELAAAAEEPADPPEVAAVPEPDDSESDS